jgi:hypothetical protein
LEANFHILATNKFGNFGFVNVNLKKIAKKLKMKIKITKLSEPQKWKQEPCWQEVTDYGIELSC